MTGGAATYFEHDGKRHVVWAYGSRYEVRELGGERLPLSSDPLFQSLAADMHRLAHEVGRLRRIELEANRRKVPA